ncbi:hypothetical protein J2X54_004778 [Duganella sp. 3397]|uniref:hypothetical protein n=1 Tax=Duganella sp. 3397 TaxID=2817732 RepID=UPI00285D6B6D|nr:hypothetical protein [Duganella sp. 3397]MDR7052274.1 hypothetical protein [Duganella sp. 3397]
MTSLKDDYLHPLGVVSFVLYLYGVGGVGLAFLADEPILGEFSSNEVFTGGVYGISCMLLYIVGFKVGSRQPLHAKMLGRVVLSNGNSYLYIAYLMVGFIFGILAMIYFAGSVQEFISRSDLRQALSAGKTWILFFLLAAKWGYFVFLMRDQSVKRFRWVGNAVVGLSVLTLLLVWGRLFALVFLMQLLIIVYSYRTISVGRALMGGIGIFIVVFVAGIHRWMQGATEAKDLSGFSENLDFLLNNINYVSIFLNNFFDGWYVYLGYLAASLRNDWNLWGGLALGTMFKVVPGAYATYSDLFLYETVSVIGEAYDTGARASNLMGEFFLDFSFLAPLFFGMLGYIIAAFYKRERAEKLLYSYGGNRIWSLVYAIILCNVLIAVRTGMAAGVTWMFVDFCWLAIWFLCSGKKVVKTSVTVG